MVTRPHILTYTTEGIPGGEDPNGFPLPDVPGSTVQLPCRFVAGGQRMFKNEDSTEVQQKGRISVDRDSTMPKQMQEVIVTMDDRELFRGPAMEIYAGGQLTRWRIDV